jgi:hypothetical protein
MMEQDIKKNSEEKIDKFDEYKFFAESTQHFSERRQKATQTYLTVNTAIFAITAVLIKDISFRGWYLVLVSFPLFMVGVLACFIWAKIINQYKKLITWRYDQLMELEETIPDCYQMYNKEWDFFYKPRQGEKKFGFARLEVWLPNMFTGLYVAFELILVAIAIIG